MVKGRSRAVRSSITAAVLAVVLSTGGAAYAQGDADWDSGVSHFKQQQFRQAISDFQKVADSHPDFANTYYYMGLSHFRLKEYGKSIVALTRYLDLAEKNGGKADAAARAVLGRAYFLTDDYQKAVTTLTVATQTVTDEPVNFYYLGVAYQRLNQNDKALEAFDREDIQTAQLVLNSDDEVDQLYYQTFKDLLEDPSDDGDRVNRSMNLILVARSLERIADHATNICEEVIYMVNSEDIRHQH